MAAENATEVEKFVAHVTKVFQDNSVPTLSAVYLSNVVETTRGVKEYVINTSWKQNCYKTKNVNEFTALYQLNSEEQKIELFKIPGFPISCENVLLQSVSPKLQLNAVIKKHENTTSKKEEFILEIWSNLESKLLTTLNLSSYEKHGKVHAGMTFGSLKWSEDESKLLYVAELKPPKPVGFFDQVSCSELENNQANKGNKFDYEESWGELLTDVTHSIICVVDINKKSIDVIPGIPEHVSAAQPQWGPNNTIVFQGIHERPFRLGLIYCTNRLSTIYQLNKDTPVLDLTSDSKGQSNYCPRVSNCKTKLIFLSRVLSGIGDPHMGSEVLMMYNFIDNSLKKVYDVDTVGNTSVALFSYPLPDSCWLNDNVHVVLPNVINGIENACIINTSSGNMLKTFECSLFGVYSDIIISSYMKLDSMSNALQVSKYIDGNILHVKSTLPKLHDMNCGYLTDTHGIVTHYLMPKHSAFSNVTVPLIVWPHGGPHTVTTDTYNLYAQVFCKLGFAVLLVNYRGSLGFSKDSLRSLPGKIGTQDVEDVHNFVIQFLNLKSDLIDKENIFLFGGSHGGFLTAHLIGQFPEFYRAAALRNPVIEVASMSLTSDIPDWTYFETGLAFSQDVLPCSDAYKSMLEKSPIVHLPNIKAPVLLCIGDKDIRVPMSQGKRFYQLLKANKKVVRMLLYPDDSHPLSAVETQGDVFVNVCKWFYVHRHIDH